MQLTQVAVFVAAFVVIDAIGDVAGLLNLNQLAAVTDGMDATSRNEEAVTVLDSILCQGIADTVILNHLLVLLRSKLLLESAVELRVRSRIQDVPHLGLSTRLALTTGDLVCGVYLNGKFLLRINELDEQGELVSETLVVSLTKQTVLLFFDKRIDILAFAHGLDTFDTRNQPILRPPYQGT